MKSKFPGKINEIAYMRTPTIVSQDACNIVGIAVRTSNQNGQAQIDLEKLWQRFYADDIPSLVSGKKTNDLYCVYTDYDSDHNGSYTAVLGYSVHNETRLPDNLTKTTIPAGNYHCYISEGKLPESLIETWQHIWHTAINRSFTTDFDVYESDLRKGADNVVKTFVAIHL